MLGLQQFLLSLAIIHLSYSGDKLPHRTPRQALENEGVENKIAGTWGLWGPWSSCSQTCGLGVIERSRTCLSPYQQVPWIPRSEQNPHIIQPQPQPQPPFHDDRSNVFSMGPARPANPFHTDGEISAAYVDPYMPRNPSSSRYNYFNRNTRQETHPGGSRPVYPRRDYPPYHRSTSNRGRGVPRNPDTLWKPSPLDVPHRQDALRAPETFSIHRKPHQDSPTNFNTRNSSRGDDASAPWPFFPDSIPLLKPESWEESQGQALPPMTPTKESRFSRRSRVRNAIKPGKYGYGKVPFALPLHTEKEESQRSKRHHKMMTFSTTASPKRDHKKELRPTQASVDKQDIRSNLSPSQASDNIGASSKRRFSSVKKPKRSSQSDYSSLTESAEYDFTIGKNVGSSTTAPKLKSSAKNTDSNQDSQFSFWDAWVEFDGHEDISEKDGIGNPLHLKEFSKKRTIQENVQKISSTQAPVNQAMKHVLEDEPIRTTILKSSATQVRKQDNKKILPTKLTSTVKPIQGHLPIYNMDSSLKKVKQAESESSRHKGRFIHENSNRQVTGTNNDSSSDEAVEAEHKPDLPHQPRSRSQRQSPHRQSTDGSRAYHSLYRDNPVQTDPWTPLGRNMPLTYDRGQDQRSSLHQNTELPQWNLYNPGTEEFHCEGEKKQYKSCNQEPCPAGLPDARTLQCSTFNNQEFMGRLYQWEAFTEGQ